MPAEIRITVTVAYFILSHTNVPQVRRLVRTILEESPGSIVLIHHDATGEPFDATTFETEPRVRILDRSIHGEWATFSLVEMALAGIDDLARSAVFYDWLVLLSGQDYPIRPLEEFEASLVASGDGRIEFDPDARGLLDRYTYVWYRFPRFLENGLSQRVVGFLTRFNERQRGIQFLSGRVGCRVGFRPRRSPLPSGMRFFKGTQWWALSRRSVDYIRTFVASNPRFVRHFRDHTIMPDEAFFQTILYNATDRFAFVNDAGRFTKWATQSAASPKTLDLYDRAEIVAGQDFFARKFDAATGLDLFEFFDERRTDRTKEPQDNLPNQGNDS